MQPLVVRGIMAQDSRVAGDLCVERGAQPRAHQLRICQGPGLANGL